MQIDPDGYFSLWGALVGVGLMVLGAAAVYVAAPVLVAAVAVGYASGAVYAAGVVGCGVVATACGAATIQESYNGENFMKDAIGDEATEFLMCMSTMGCCHGISTMYVPKQPEPIGKPFDPKGPSVQEGVDPHTLTPTKDLSTLDPQRLKQVQQYGMNQSITVYRDGTIEDGHHRLRIALENNAAVDVNVLGR